MIVISLCKIMVKAKNHTYKNKNGKKCQMNINVFHFNMAAAVWQGKCVLLRTWHFCSKRASDKLEKINERALRFVYQDNNSSYEMLLKSVVSKHC